MIFASSWDFITLSGWIMTTLGLTVAAIQTLRVRRISAVNKSRVETFIGDANYVSLEPELLQEIAKHLNRPDLMHYLTCSHQRGCDMYMSLVDYYLAERRRFTYVDLQRMCQTTLINYRWQERHWRSRIALRSENSKLSIPTEYYLTDQKSYRFQSYKNSSE